MNIKWKSRKEGYQEALHYISGRKIGEITSLKTPWPKFNDSGVSGIEWQSMVLIGARPSTGKTLLKDQIINQAFDLNPTSKFRVLDFRLEMISRVTAIREYSSVLRKTYKYLCSADEKLSDNDLLKCYEYSKEKADPEKYPIDIIEETCTVHEFVQIVHDYMKKYKSEGEYTKTLIAIDHTLLFEGTDDQSMLSTLGKALTFLKKAYPIIFIVLSQLNRNIERPERNEDGKYGNYINTSDIFGSDSLLQHADLVIGINRPALQKIKFYGPDRYIIEDDTVLVFHFLKARNGDNRISFFRAEFDKMLISQMETPPMVQKRSKLDE